MQNLLYEWVDFSKVPKIWAKIGSNLRKFWKNRVILLKIWPKIGPIGIWMGHFFLKNFEKTFKYRGGTSLPKPNLSTPRVAITRDCMGAIFILLVSLLILSFYCTTCAVPETVPFLKYTHKYGALWTKLPLYLISTLSTYHPGGGGYFHQNHTCMCVPDLENLPFFPSISIPFLKENEALNFDQIGCFLQSYAQITPNLCNFGSFVSEKKILRFCLLECFFAKFGIAIPNFTEKNFPKDTHIFVYHVNVGTPQDLPLLKDRHDFHETLFLCFFLYSDDFVLIFLCYFSSLFHLINQCCFSLNSFKHTLNWIQLLTVKTKQKWMWYISGLFTLSAYRFNVPIIASII